MRGLDADSIRFQPACHNKCIIVDDARVVFGSHNWSNEGVATNRDASLIFHEPQIAEYFSKVYAHDWKYLATAEPAAPRKRPRLAEPDDGDDTVQLGATEQ
jgi:phosphatidylserine/phosphatidylglycerophosphate/cardiolipin synthase-like enzyme